MKMKNIGAPALVAILILTLTLPAAAAEPPPTPAPSTTEAVAPAPSPAAAEAATATPAPRPKKKIEKAAIDFVFEGVPEKDRKLYRQAAEFCNLDKTVAAYGDERAELRVVRREGERTRMTLTLQFHEDEYLASLAGKGDIFRGARVLRLDYYLGALSVLIWMDHTVQEHGDGRPEFEMQKLFLELEKPGWGSCRLPALAGRSGIRPVRDLWIKEGDGPEKKIPTARPAYTKANFYYVIGSTKTSSGAPSPYARVTEFFGLEGIKAR